MGSRGSEKALAEVLNKIKSLEFSHIRSHMSQCEGAGTL